jgi:two-component system KDP operon response regulator KdpE
MNMKTEPENSETVLVLDDETSIRRLLSMTLSVVGYSVVEAANGREGMHLVASHRPQVIILDLTLPDEDGMKVLKRLREWYRGAIIILSVRKTEKDIVGALEAGANDYMCKPFLPGELVARIRASLRRINFATENNPVFRLGELFVDLVDRTVKKGDTPIKLTPSEFSLLSMFVRNAGRVLPHKKIMNEIWGEHINDTQSLRVFVAHLRKKIEDDPSKPQLLVSESGIGYRFG